MSNFGYLKCIFLALEALSELSLSKNVLIPIDEVLEIHHPAKFFACGVECLPYSYLCLPLGASFKCKSVWDPIVERFHKLEIV